MRSQPGTFVARSVREVESLRPVWQQAEISDIDSDIDYFLTVVAHAPHVVRPHVVRIPRTGRRDLLAIARIERMPLPLSLGYWRLRTIERRAVVVAFGGLAGISCDEDRQLLLEALEEPLRNNEADLLVLRDVDTAGRMSQQLTAFAPWWRRSHGQTVSRRWVAEVPDSLDAFLVERSAKTRQTLRRQDRKLVRNYGQRMQLRRFAGEDDLDALISDMRAVASKTYQEGLGAAFSASPMELALIRTGLAHGWYRAWMLYIDDAAVAFWDGTTFSKTFATGTPGFDPAFTKDSVGRFTMFRMIEDLCLDPSVSMIDFGHGEADYKAAYGRPARCETTVAVAAARVSPAAALAAYSLFSVVNTTARRLVARSALARRIKKDWRNRLAGG